jgi:anti-sigma B factor antagonist
MLTNAAYPLQVSLTDDGYIVRLVLSGELDIASAAALERELEVAESRRPPVLVLDLGELRFMGVSGLRTILDAARRARRDSRQFVIANPVPHIKRLFELTAIDQSLELLRSPLFAVAGAAAQPPLGGA